MNFFIFKKELKKINITRPTTIEIKLLNCLFLINQRIFRMFSTSASIETDVILKDYLPVEEKPIGIRGVTATL